MDIEIKGVKLEVADDVDVQIDGDVVTIKAKPMERVVEHHHHYGPTWPIWQQPYATIPTVTDIVWGPIASSGQ